MKRVAKVYGAEDATAILDLDLVVVNKTLYVPWSSAQNGRSSGMSFAQISLAANEEATFNFRFEDSTSGEVTPIAYGVCARLPPRSLAGHLQHLGLRPCPLPNYPLEAGPSPCGATRTRSNCEH